jgi:hypothetical protein
MNRRITYHARLPRSFIKCEKCGEKCYINKGKNPPIFTVGFEYDSNRKVYNLKSSHKSYLISLYHYFYDFANFYFQRKKNSFSLVMLTPRDFRELKTSKPRNA